MKQQPTKWQKQTGDHISDPGAPTGFFVTEKAGTEAQSVSFPTTQGAGHRLVVMSLTL